MSTPNAWLHARLENVPQNQTIELRHLPVTPTVLIFADESFEDEDGAEEDEVEAIGAAGEPLIGCFRTTQVPRLKRVRLPEH